MDNWCFVRNVLSVLEEVWCSKEVMEYEGIFLVLVWNGLSVL